MKRIARKFFLPLLLGSVLIFAIEIAQVSASNIPSADYEVVQTRSFVKLENDTFWDKFRESVMKDKDKNKDNPEQSPGNNEPPQDDVGDNSEHSISYSR